VWGAGRAARLEASSARGVALSCSCAQAIIRRELGRITGWVPVHKSKLVSFQKGEINNMKRPFALWILVFWLAFLSLGGLYGGIAMLLDPSGGSLQMTEVLSLLPVPNYVLPGLFLLFIMGILPLFLIYGLLVRPNWSWLDSIFRQIKYYWAWTGTVILCVILAIWLLAEGALIGFKWPIQYVTAVNGLFILIFIFFPSVRNYYKK